VTERYTVIASRDETFSVYTLQNGLTISY